MQGEANWVIMEHF